MVWESEEARRYPLYGNAAQCVELVGHCYVDLGYVAAIIPPVYHRVCKHCGHRQSGRPQEAIRWVDET